MLVDKDQTVTPFHVFSAMQRRENGFVDEQETLTILSQDDERCTNLAAWANTAEANWLYHRMLDVLLMPWAGVVDSGERIQGASPWMMDSIGHVYNPKGKYAVDVFHHIQDRLDIQFKHLWTHVEGGATNESFYKSFSDYCAKIDGMSIETKKMVVETVPGQYDKVQRKIPMGTGAAKLVHLSSS